MTLLLVLRTEQGYLYINLRKDSEYVSLQHGDEDLEAVQHERHGDGDHGHVRAEVQDKAQEDEDEQVPGQYVRVEPHRQREGLGELSRTWLFVGIGLVEAQALFGLAFALLIGLGILPG